jgi:hypothetical protein
MYNLTVCIINFNLTSTSQKGSQEFNVSDIRAMTCIEIDMSGNFHFHFLLHMLYSFL